MADDRVCIVGAGSSGIAAAKVLKDHGIDFDCLEMGSCIGGNWIYDNPNGRSSVYRSTFINTSKWMMQFSDFPMPKDYPAFPHHTQIARYFNAYVDHFELGDRVEFGRQVVDVAAVNGGWSLTMRDGSVRRYRAVLVASGHHWDEKWPSFPGRFDGEETHAHSYRTPEGYLGKRVLVVGIGNSAVDIASELSRVAEATFVATRRGAHVIPKFLGARPVDQYLNDTVTRLPVSAQRALFGSLLRISQGRMSEWGLPEPDHRLLEAHPTISGEFLQRIKHGQITVKPNIAELDGQSVTFADGSVEPLDAIIYATGYKINFPFLPAHVFSAPDNRVRLYRQVVHPHRGGLFFIGLVQPLGAIMPLAELQAVWVANLIRGYCHLPSPPKMEREIDRDLARMARRYVGSSRHTIQVDFFPYRRQLRRELKRSRRGGPAGLDGRFGGKAKASRRGFLAALAERARVGAHAPVKPQR